MLITNTNTEWRQFAESLTNRQLIKQYKDLQDLYAILVQPAYRNKPGALYQGESAFLQELDVDRGIFATWNELRKRGYKIQSLPGYKTQWQIKKQAEMA